MRYKCLKVLHSPFQSGREFAYIPMGFYVLKGVKSLLNPDGLIENPHYGH